MNLYKTIYNERWLRANWSGLCAALPDTWTHMENLDGMKIGYRLKLLGVDWRSNEEFGEAMTALEKAGVLIRRHGYQVRAVSKPPAELLLLPA